jgi:hypothetical protein
VRVDRGTYSSQSVPSEASRDLRGVADLRGRETWTATGETDMFAGATLPRSAMTRAGARVSE